MRLQDFLPMIEIVKMDDSRILLTSVPYNRADGIYCDVIAGHIYYKGELISEIVYFDYSLEFENHLQCSFWVGFGGGSLADTAPPPITGMRWEFNNNNWFGTVEKNRGTDLKKD